MKHFLPITSLFLLFAMNALCCDTTRIDRTLWEIISVSSEETTGEGESNGHAIHALDNNLSTYWHTEWKEQKPDYPHHIAIDLKDTVDINAFSITTRGGTNNGRINQFELYITNDTTNWGIPQIAHQLDYPMPQKGEQQTSYYEFGAIKGRFFKLVGINSLHSDPYVMIAELNIYKDETCPATGQINQTIDFTTINKQYVKDRYIVLQAISSVSLPITYELKSGPGIISADTLYFTGASGNIEVSAIQTGDVTYYPTERSQTFEVVNLNDIHPTLITRFTDHYPIEMPQLYPYLLYALPAIEEANQLSIESLSFTIADTVIEAQYINGVYQAWWTPTNYGYHTITTLAKSSNGNTVTLVKTVEISKPNGSQQAKTFDAAVIDFGTIGSQWYYGSYNLPQSVAAYNQIIGHFDVTCPNVPGGCDDWDRLGWVEIKAPNGQWVELFRYITPYGVACTHSVDLTDYASLLQGEVEFRMYIETWGTGGWQLDLTLEYTAGKPEYKYSYVETLWLGTYNFGNPANLQPIDTLTLTAHPGSQNSVIRLVTSGHGWGENNTKNAAEFYNAKHNLKVNNTEIFEHNPWMICNPNPDGCTGQKGTWTHSRAGWCPGAIGQIHHYNLTTHLSQTPITLSYIFQESYVDLCHPNHPDCVSGKTCKNCNDTYNPHYRIGGYLIHHSNQPIGAIQGDYLAPDSQQGFSFSFYPNPATDYLFLDTEATFTDATLVLMDVSGKALLTYFFKDQTELAQAQINLTHLPDGIYYLKLYTKNKSKAQKLIIIR